MSEVLAERHITTRERVDSMIMSALGPVAELLEDESVIEIMVNPDGNVWIERLGKGLIRTNRMLYPFNIDNFLRLVASSQGLVCNAGSPRLSTTLSGSGARLQGFVPPVVRAPCFVLRIPAKRVFTLDDYVESGVITQSQRIAIEDAVQDRKNIIIAGGTGSGKTTLANALLDVLSKTGERIVTLEDTQELQCSAPNVLSLSTYKDVCTMHDLVIDTMRTRPDRIVVGEVREGGATLEFLKASGTGHPGSICTCHADSARRVLTRIEQLVQEVVVTIPRQFIAEVIDIIIFIERFGTGWRLQEVLAVDGFEKNEYQLRSLVSRDTPNGGGGHGEFVR